VYVGTILNLKRRIDRECGDATFDFSGTSEKVLMNRNAAPTLAYAATIYCIFAGGSRSRQGCHSVSISRLFSFD